MRQIKFRGFDDENKTWRYGHFFETVEGIRRCYNIVENRDTKYYCNPNSIGQFTGLADKNGVDIYEGDLLDYGHNRKLEVIFYRGRFSVKYLESGQIDDVWLRLEHFNVIGNIHQSQEVLNLKFA